MAAVSEAFRRILICLPWSITSDSSSVTPGGRLWTDILSGAVKPFAAVYFDGDFNRLPADQEYRLGQDLQRELSGRRYRDVELFRPEIPEARAFAADDGGHERTMDYFPARDRGRADDLDRSVSQRARRVRQ